MVHDRIADQRDLDDLLAGNPGLGRRLADQRVDGLAHDARHLGGAVRVHHRIGHAAHQVLAEADLRVHRTDRGEDRAARKIAEIGGDGGRADVDRDSIGVHGEAR